MALQDSIWAGTEQSLQAAITADDAKSARMTAGSFSDTQDPQEKPRLLEVNGGVAIISIKGSLNNNDEPFWNQYCGMTGYPEIRDAVIAAAQDAAVQHILLDIDSGGGSVAGVEDTAKLIRSVTALKPVSAYSDGAMCSAAYWLGSAADTVYAGKATILGSIGVISTHMERSKMLADAGIGVTVVRSGQFKALANGVEKLSAEGKASIQKIVDAADGVFVDAVSEMRGKSVEYVRASMGQGREFIGQEAVDVGLIDAVTSFDQLLSNIQSSLPSDNGLLNNRGKSGNGFGAASDTNIQGDSSMARQALTEQQIAAIASGAGTLDAAAGNLDSTDTVVDGAEGGEALANTEGTEALANTEAAVDLGANSAVSAQVDTLSATVQLLTAQLKEKDADLLQANVKLSKLEDSFASMKASHDPMVAIVAASASNLMVALGGSAMSLEGMGAEALLAEHTRLSGAFKEKYKAGGVSAVQGDAETVDTHVSPRQKARVNAARFTPTTK